MKGFGHVNTIDRSIQEQGAACRPLTYECPGCPPGVVLSPPSLNVCSCLADMEVLPPSDFQASGNGLTAFIESLSDRGLAPSSVLIAFWQGVCNLKAVSFDLLPLYTDASIGSINCSKRSPQPTRNIIKVNMFTITEPNWQHNSTYLCTDIIAFGFIVEVTFCVVLQLLPDGVFFQFLLPKVTISDIHWHHHSTYPFSSTSKDWKNFK